MKPHDSEPATTVIARFGGPEEVAKVTNRDVSAVRRWRMPKPQGTGGVIPDEAKVLLIKSARERGLDLAWADFAPPGLSDGAANPEDEHRGEEA